MSNKHKLSKAEWIQHQRDVEQQKLTIVETGKREALQKQIDVRKKAYAEAWGRFDKAKAAFKEVEVDTWMLTAKLESEYKAFETELHILNIGSLYWEQIQNAISEMQDRLD